MLFWGVGIPVYLGRMHTAYMVKTSVFGVPEHVGDVRKKQVFDFFLEETPFCRKSLLNVKQVKPR